MNSLDTNLVLRFVVGDVPNQTEKAQRLITSSTCYVTDVVVVETVFVLEKFYELSRKDIAHGMKRFLALPNIIYNSQVIDDAINLFAEAAGLSFVDCYSTVEAAMADATLYTFDKDLIKLGGEHVVAP